MNNLKNLNLKLYYSGFLLAILFLALLPWIFIDVDQGDQAFHTLHSWLLAFVVRQEAGPGYWQDTTATWGSLYLGALWWRLIGPEAGLLAFRFGWIVLNILTAQVLFWVFSSIYSEKKSFLAVLMTALVVNCAADHFVLSYNSLGPALGAISFSLLCLSFSASQERNRLLMIFASGFTATAAVFARLPSLPFMLLFLTIALGSSIFLDKKSLKGGKLLLLYGLGAFSSFFLFYLALKSANQWNMYRDGFWEFFQAVASDSSEKHTKGATISRALGHYYKIAIGGVLFVAMAVLMSFFQKSLGKMIFLLSLLVFFLLTASKYGIALSIIIGGCALISTVLILQNYKKPSTQKLLFFSASGLLLTAFTFGTNLEGLQNYKYGVWILFPFALLELENIKIRFFDTKKIYSFLSICAVVLFITTRLQWPTFPYFENPIITMKQKFEAPILRGIITYKEKGDSLDSLYDFLQKQGVSPGSSIMAYSAIPPFYPIALVYLMTKTIPPFHNPTMVEYPGTSWVKHKKVIEELVSQKKFVNIIVRQSKPFPIRKNGLYSLNLLSRQEEPEAQITPFSWAKIESLGAANELDLILKSGGYKPIWENNHFVVLKK